MAETFAPPRIESERRSDGRLLIRSVEPLADHPISVVHTFRAHSDAHPERLLVAATALVSVRRATARC